MKKYGIILIVVLLVSCKQGRQIKNNTITNYFNLADLTEFPVDILEVKSGITTMFDSIIIKINSCEKYKNLPLGFIFESYKDTLGGFKIHVSNTVEMEKLNFEDCTGVFYYNGYKFVYFGELLSEFFLPLNKKELVFFISPEKMDWIDNKYGEFFNSSWDFTYNSGVFKCYHYSYCGSFWTDETYRQNRD